MDDILTYVIVGLFFVFLLYFIYTVVDVFFLSKRKRKVKSPISHEKREDDIKNEDSEKTSEDKLNLRKPFDEESNKTEIVESSVEELEDESINESTKKSITENNRETSISNASISENVNLEVQSAKEVIKKQSMQKKNFSLFGFMKKKKTKPIFEREKIDEKYHELIVDFVDKNINGWNQAEFYEFIALLVKKGYDRRPSEVLEDLEIVKKEMIEERRVKSESNLLSNDSSTSDESDNISNLDDSEVEEIIKKDNQSSDFSNVESETKKEDSSEDKLKELSKKNKESINTRSELDKTLEEIRAIRKRLSQK